MRGHSDADGGRLWRSRGIHWTSQFLSDRDPKAVFSKDGLFDELKMALAERVLNAELEEHLEGRGSDGAGADDGQQRVLDGVVNTQAAKQTLRVGRIEAHKCGGAR